MHTSQASLSMALNRIITFLALAVFSAGALAQPLAMPKYIAGEHYQVLANPMKLAADDKIEVMEVFWYGCGHCKTFEPLAMQWKETIDDDVEFMRTPAIWQKVMRSHAALYYVAETLQLPQSIHMELFDLLVSDRRLDNPKKFADVFARHGVSEEDFNKIYKSFGMTSKINQAEKRARKNYLVQGTPEMIVNGKYRVAARMAGGLAQMLDVVDFLVELERNAAQ